MRVLEHEPRPLGLLLADAAGLPSLGTFEGAATLLVLPACARQEVHR